MDYVVRYGMIPSRTIFNYCGPRTLDYVMEGFTKEEADEKAVLSERWLNRYNKENQFYVKLEESILEEGFRNPLLIIAGSLGIVPSDQLPKYMKEDTEKILVCDSNGGSRLWVAQKYDMDVPCLVSDFVDMFPNFAKIESTNEMKELYKDTPEMLKYNEEGLWIKGLPHAHLGESNG